MGTIIVGVDGSQSSADALRWAAEEAGRRGWATVAVLCWGYLDQHHAAGDAFDPGYSEADAQATIDASVVAALGESATVPVERIVVNDLPARGLLERSMDADLLVVGARGLSPIKELVLGSVSQQCLEHSPIPVVVVKRRPEPHPAFDRIVVGVDGSEASRRAVEWAVEAGRVRRAAVAAVSAWTPPGALRRYVMAGPSAPEAFETATREILDEIVDGIDAAGLQTPLTRAVIGGDARTVLVEQAETADLVVVGSRGHGGFAGLLLGSVSNHVAQRAGCPVVVLPHGRPVPPTDAQNTV